MQNARQPRVRFHFAFCILGFAFCISSGTVQAQTWGDVKGRVIWGGKNVPAPAKLQLPPGDPSTPICIKANKGEEPPDESFVVHQKNMGLRDVFVWLADFDDPRSKKPLPTHPKLKAIKVKQVEMDQPACHFIPHAIALREGQELVVKNSAPFLHSFKWGGDPNVNPGESVAMAPGSTRTIKPATDRLPIEIQCTVHTKMRSWMRVFSHPYFAVTDENGAFEFKDAPAGKYRLMIWHANGWLGGKDGNRGQLIDIEAGKVVNVGDLAFAPN